MIVCFVIGNSDDKLAQADWSKFLADVHAAVGRAKTGGAIIHFSGHSGPGAPWQNALWAFEPPSNTGVVAALRLTLSDLAYRYRQDSIAWWESHWVEMLGPAKPGPVVPR